MAILDNHVVERNIVHCYGHLNKAALASRQWRTLLRPRNSVESVSITILVNNYRSL